MTDKLKSFDAMNDIIKKIKRDDDFRVIIIERLNKRSDSLIY